MGLSNNISERIPGIKLYNPSKTMLDKFKNRNCVVYSSIRKQYFDGEGWCESIDDSFIGKFEELFTKFKKKNISLGLDYLILNI